MEQHMGMDTAGRTSGMLRTRVFPRPRLVEPVLPAVLPPRAIDGGSARPARGAAAPFPGRDLDAIVARVAPSRVSVVITGETGVGKDVLANRIHAASPRAGKPMVCLNCAAVCETLIDSELFGHRRGAFTGADQSRVGLIEAADGGTLFLDEIGELSLTAQTKLLRVLETRQVTRVGGVSQRQVDVRFIAATNRDLDANVRQGRFRADLLFRLDGIRLHLSPLRERPTEILPAAERLLGEYAEREGAVRLVLDEAAQHALVHHDWPGNFRELRNVLERAAVLCDGGTILEHDLVFSRTELPIAEARTDFECEDSEESDAGGEGDAPERQRIVSALQACAGNQTRAAQMLGISRRTLLTRLEMYGIPRPKLRPLAIVAAPIA